MRHTQIYESLVSSISEDCEHYSCKGIPLDLPGDLCTFFSIFDFILRRFVSARLAGSLRGSMTVRRNARQRGAPVGIQALELRLKGQLRVFLKVRADACHKHIHGWTV